MSNNAFAQQTNNPFASGGGASQYTLISSLHGASLVDPTPVLDGGTTGFANGVFTLDYSGDQTLLNGYNEIPGWVIPILSLHSDYDPTIHVLDVLIEPVSMPDVDADRGIAIALIERSAVSGSSGSGVSFFTDAVGVRKTCGLAQTGSGTPIISSDLTMNAVRVQFEFSSDASQTTIQLREDETWRHAVPDVGDDMGGLVPTNWHLAVGGYQGPSGTPPATAYICSYNVSTRLLLRGELP